MEAELNIPKAIVDAANARKLVLFLGAGASTGAGMPTWGEIVCDLLKEKADRIDEPELLLKTIEAGLFTPLEIIDKMANYKTLIYNHFENKLKNPKDSALHKLMGNITQKFITTNFDKLIEYNCAIDNVIDHTSSYNLGKIDSIDSYILKIHGDISRADHCLIFSSDYEKVYNPSSLSAFQLGKIVTQNKCIFVGFSFNDPHVSSFFKHLDEMYNKFEQQYFSLGKEKIQQPYIENIIIKEYSEIFDFFSALEVLMSSVPPVLYDDPAYPELNENIKKELSQPLSGSSDEETEQVKNIYYEHLKKESIYPISGPIDIDVMLKASALEKLFIPLKFFPKKLEINPFESSVLGSLPMLGYKYGHFNPIPEEGIFHTVVFSGPGGGKTTWMKRLISAYAHRNFDGFGDRLPQRELFPIWIKCRDFKEETTLSIFEIIEKIPDRASINLNSQQKQAFINLVRQHIQKGTSVILIDGIDEITIDFNRNEFIRRVKEFVENNNKANIVMTSRKVGFEKITKKLFSDFQYWEIQPFSKEDIENFCIGWYKIFFGDAEKVIENAKNISNTIINDERVLKLAEIPVLLQMLMLISKKFSDRLPARIVNLYEDAVIMLLDKWNQDGFPTIEIRDGLPLMAYLAHHMMFINGVRRTIGMS